MVRSWLAKPVQVKAWRFDSSFFRASPAPNPYLADLGAGLLNRLEEFDSPIGDEKLKMSWQ